ncbi:DUF4383 domain-containing protein [Amycolatopsis sp. BJA-103]|uniref:DUF4383 domain-containing protein n=1 Tax=unclassified Amycolatopsis TaxID=2618356 RepID=UPI000C789318|nr:DUF4383 domain-containing protein [Amycolatopsis sp. BJA-103]AUI60240.1 hypothetical protein BKN51_19925 [Amycolatopsis sp. BJA-103]PNE13549.1 hypothetical protein B1H26_39485 [Amycolatopsis sp. BJA-103]
MSKPTLRVTVLVLALVHLTVGVLGFFFVPETDQTGENTVWIFSSTGMLDLLRVATGVIGLIAVLRPALISLYSWFVFVAFAGLTGFGILSASTTSAGDAVNLNWADNVLHALTSLVALAVAIVVVRQAERPSETVRE